MLLTEVKMAWRNIWRNPRRTILTIAAIAFACLLLVFMLSFQFGSYDTMINSSVKIHTGHLQIQAKGYHKNKNIRRVLYHPDAVSDMLDGITTVEGYTYRADGFALVASKDRTYGVAVIGIDPSRETRVSSLKELIQKGEFLTPDSIDEALVGKRLAKNLNIAIGDEVTLLGQGRDGAIAAGIVKIKGIYSSGIDEFDRNSIHIHLKTFQEIYNMQGTIHRVVITGTSLKSISDIKTTIAASLNRMKSVSRSPASKPVVLDWKTLMPGLPQSIKLDLISGVIFYVILILVVAFSILNTFLMAIFERTREFGVLMALGTTPGRLTKLLLIESMGITLLGIVIGMSMGILIILYFQIYGIDIAGASDLLSQYGISGRIFPRLSWISVLSGPGVVFVITFFAALYPALKVRSLRPVAAIAHV